MVANLLRVAFRSLRRNRGFALLNVVGLALGMACVILIALYIQDERGVDAFHDRSDRIARLDISYVDDDGAELAGRTPGILAPTLEASMPQVEAAVRFTNADRVVQARGEAFQAEEMYLVDPSVFGVFSFPFRAGDSETALAQPGSIVLTESFASTLFGNAPALGEPVQWKGETLMVTGVMEDLPRQSHLQFDGLVSLSTVEDPGWFYGNWFSVGFATYALLREGATVEQLASGFPAFVEAEAGEAMEAEGESLILHATPLSDLYLTVDRGLGEFGNGTTLRILALVALFVLLVAAVNFTNLATARSLDRAREVGVRKTLGAGRNGLAGQFLMEAVVLSAVATILAVLVAQLALPAFRELSGKPLSLVDLGLGWIGIVGLAGVTGLLAGAYPALVLSGFRPAEVLKGRFSSGQRGQALRQGLVVLQFGISVALIAATAIVFSQLRHMQSKDLGFDLGGEQTQLLTLPFMADSTVISNLAEIHARFVDLPGVTGTTASLSAPTYGTYTAGGSIERPEGPDHELSVGMYIADTSYAEVYGISLLAGRTPRAGSLADDGRLEYVLNETASREAGYSTPDAVIGKSAQFWGLQGEVVGVMKDFHVDGLQLAVEPLALAADDGEDPFARNVLTVRVRVADLSETLANMESIWTETAPTRPFEYSFLDEEFAEQYVAELRFGRLFGVFSGLAIAIACLGLFGLAAHAAAQRTKEIGVRRVLGATVAQVVVLLSRNVVVLVGAGIALAVPVVVVGMSRWLDTFAYRIDVGWVPLTAAAGMVLLIALVTVGGHAARAALADPVRALRSE
ncbi:MAG: ABC transporter permease [Rubricoccaceae bacterium]